MDDEQVAVTINDERCIGSGMCEMLEEATFLINEDTNIAQVIGTATLSRERALVVIDRCPSSAIALVECHVAAAEEEE